MPLGAKVEKNEKVANKGIDRINAVKMRMPVYNSLVNSIVGNSGKVDEISYSRWIHVFKILCEIDSFLSLAEIFSCDR